MSTSDQHAVADAYRRQTAAMLTGDTDELNDLLADDYVAIHIGGYRQPKAEWLDQIARGSFRYHSITVTKAIVTVAGDTAHLTADAAIDVTISGGRGTWSVRSEIEYRRSGSGWLAVRSRTIVA